jgi:hypothetical protein
MQKGDQMKFVMFFIAFLISFNTFSVSAATWRRDGGQKPNGQKLNCPEVPLMTDGGFLTISIKRINVKVSPDQIPEFINALADVHPPGPYNDFKGLVGDIIPGTDVRCTVVTQVLNISRDPKEEYNVTVGINGSCAHYSNFAQTNDFEHKLMRSVIEEIVKLPNIEVDPVWSVQPPCLGGGVTGSN